MYITAISNQILSQPWSIVAFLWGYHYFEISKKSSMILEYYAGTYYFPEELNAPYPLTALET